METHKKNQPADIMTDVQLVLINVPGADEVHFEAGGSVVTFDSDSATDPGAVTQAVAMVRDTTVTTKWTGTVTVADPLVNSIGTVAMDVTHLLGGSNIMASTYNSRARFTMGASDMVFTFDYATGRWSGDGLTDKEVELSIVNHLPEYRYVEFLERGSRFAS